jgi:hypothetical protein
MFMGDRTGMWGAFTHVKSRYIKKKKPVTLAVNAKNIGLNEYEGHSLYDMVYGNKTDIDIDMVTGDNHSLNQLNFVALEFARISPIAWVYMLFTGRYNFKKSSGNIDIAAMAHRLEMHLKQPFWKAA